MSRMQVRTVQEAKQRNKDVGSAKSAFSLISRGALEYEKSTDHLTLSQETETGYR